MNRSRSTRSETRRMENENAMESEEIVDSDSDCQEISSIKETTTKISSRRAKTTQKADKTSKKGNDISVIEEVKEESEVQPITAAEAAAHTKLMAEPATSKVPMIKYLKYYREALLELQESSIPDSIPCRDQEKKIVEEFLEEGLINKGIDHSLYISGVPGIGKTVSVMEVIKSLQAKYNKGKKQTVELIYVNGLALWNPEQVYVQDPGENDQLQGWWLQQSPEDPRRNVQERQATERHISAISIQISGRRKPSLSCWMSSISS